MHSSTKEIGDPTPESTLWRRNCHNAFTTRYGFMLYVMDNSCYAVCMILSYRNSKTERFAAGKYVKDFSGFARQAETRLDRLDAAISLKDLSAIGGNHLEALK